MIKSQVIQKIALSGAIYSLIFCSVIVRGTVEPCSCQSVGIVERQEGWWLPDTYVDVAGGIERVLVGDTCNHWHFACGGCCEPCDNECATHNLPSLLDVSIMQDWGNQGPSVVVCGCGSVFPAKGLFKVDGDTVKCSLQRDELEWQENCNNNVVTHTGVFASTSMAMVRYFFMAYYDPNVFIVNGSSGSGFQFLGENGGGICVTLKKTDCETLKKALKSTVQVYKQRYQCSMYGGSCGSACNPPNPKVTPFKGVLGEPVLLQEVKIVMVPSDLCSSPDEPSPKPNPDPGLNPKPQPMPRDGSNGQGGCSGGCGSGAGSGSGLSKFQIGHASFSLDLSLDNSLGVYGSLGFWGDQMPEINAGGVWLRALHSPWSKDQFSCTYEKDGDDTVTKISVNFSVLAWDRYTYHYEYEQSGQWTKDPAKPSVSAEQIAWEAIRSKIRLKNITQKVNGVDVIICDFSYYACGNVEKQRSFDENGNPNGYIIYAYETASQFQSPLTRIWAGRNQGDYVAPPGIPTGGRWIDVEFEPTGDSHGAKLYSASFACSECQPKRIYELGGPDGDQVTAVKKEVLDAQSQPVEVALVKYTYDDRGRFTSHWLGENQLKVAEWIHSDYDPGDPNGTTGNNILIRRDFVDNTTYRAKVLMADDRGALVKEIHYHQLQNYDSSNQTNWLVGPYSVYTYAHEYNAQDGLSYITTFPKGNQLRKYYDSKGNIVKIQWEGAASPEVQYQFQDYYYGGITSDPNMRISQVTKAINAYGGETVYAYTGLNMTSRTEPVPEYGISDNSSQVVEYQYDTMNRLSLERKKDSTGQWVSTKYEYDAYGNMIKQTEAYGTDKALETVYEYNEFNENIKIVEPGNRIHRKFYSSAGTLIAEAVFEDDTNHLALSATLYVYENGKLVARKTAKEDEPFVFTGLEGTITWVTEAYEYDDYGRRISVIADADGEHLVTHYEYNNQGEIVCVLKPDQRYQRTIRDGRGLVSMEITGIKIGDNYLDKAVTRFFYDLNGNLIKKVDPEGVTEIYQYDSRDRMVKSRRGR